MGLFDWLFPKTDHTTPTPVLEEPRRPSRLKSFTLVEATYDPDGDNSDFEWRGFHVHDNRGVGLTYAEAEDFNLQIFRVAGVTHRADALQRTEFEPGNVLKLVAEDNNPYDRNAVSVWDRYCTWMIGYVPKERNVRIRAAMQLPGHTALALGEHRKEGKRVSLTVIFGPLEVKS